MEHDLTLVFDGKLPSMNEIINKDRANKYIGAKLKKEFSKIVGCAFKQQAKGIRFDTHVTVTVHVYEANLKRDDDNVLFGASKIILDVLQTLGIIKNDSPRWCHLVMERFQSVDKKYRTVVYIDA